ncbi:hypothetical protein MHM89_01195 [Pseudoalteromonas sp. CNC9-20]|uniref:hypothetical protein n=1 Tax=Pseudoalteromonas sp. CNC9-20 TaxID=2917750 RepID=UPI001EF571BC|nr:hypothetical protein [Pseudoalteromonas sp. CNC9-20]MCG7568531.1 hypothetical protein [Pseudoalteromonas sp. CNC9-20]
MVVFSCFNGDVGSRGVGIWWFSFGLGFSQSPEDWAYFATYVSGLTLPILTVGSVIGILFTLLEQKRGNGEQSKANENAEADRLKSARLADAIEDKKDRRHKEKILADVQVECVKRIVRIADKIYETKLSTNDEGVRRDQYIALVLGKVSVDVLFFKNSIPTDLESYPEPLKQLVSTSLKATVGYLSALHNNFKNINSHGIPETLEGLKSDSNALKSKYGWLIQNSNS